MRGSSANMRGSIARVSETRRDAGADADADDDARSDGCEESKKRATERCVVYGARAAERDRFARRARAGELERARGAVDRDANETPRFFIVGRARGANKHSKSAASKTTLRNQNANAQTRAARQRTQ